MVKQAKSTLKLKKTPTISRAGVDIDKIIPYTKNAKKHPDKQLKLIAKSLQEFGCRQPIIIDKNNEIIVGHGRWLAYMKYKDDYQLKEPTIERADDLTPQQVKAYRLVDNKLNESDWDMDLAIEELRELDDYHFELTGFDEDMLLEADDRDNIIPEEPPVVAKLGDIWQLGKHRLMCGDSTSVEDITKLMNGQRAQMCFTDPPYNVNYKGIVSRKKGMFYRRVGRSGIKNDAMSAENFKEFLSQAVKRILDNTDGGIYICMSSKELGALHTVFDKEGGHWQNDIIWVKQRIVFGGSDYQNMYEIIMYGWRKNAVKHYFIQRRDLQNIWEDLSKVSSTFDGKNTIISFHGFQVKLKGKIEKGEVMKKKQRTNIWRHHGPVNSKLHPTMKPVALVEEAIINSSRRGEIVLDIFGGSGSTLIASEKTGRICYMQELDPKYCDVIIQRYEDYTENKAIKL